MVTGKVRDNSRYTKGIWAENSAKIYLRLKGYKVLESRLRTPVGEIDILAKKNNTYIVVEVKYRKTMDTALYAITPQKQQRLIKASTWVMAHYNTEKIRFDAVLLSVKQIKHIENAFGQY